MALPKIATPKFFATVPSTKKKISFRPFIVKEEKVLLLASESDDEEQMIVTIRDILNSCVLEDGFDANVIPYFDFEYLFLNVRAKSIGEKIQLEYRHRGGVNYKDEKCDVVTPVEIDVESIQVKSEDSHTTKIMLTDTLGIQMRYPTIEDMKKLTKTKDDLTLVANCIDFAFDGDTIHETESEKDSIEFLESLSSKQFEKIMQFFNTMPKLKHEISYKCKGCGQDDNVTLEGIADFF